MPLTVFSLLCARHVGPKFRQSRAEVARSCRKVQTSIRQAGERAVKPKTCKDLKDATSTTQELQGGVQQNILCNLMINFACVSQVSVAKASRSGPRWNRDAWLRFSAGSPLPSSMTL